MNDKIPDFVKIALLRNCNNQVDEFNQVVNQLQQYSLCTVLVIPKKYEERVVNELELLNNDFNTPVAYQIEEAKDGNVTVALFNFG